MSCVKVWLKTSSFHTANDPLHGLDGAWSEGRSGQVRSMIKRGALHTQSFKTLNDINYLSLACFKWPLRGLTKLGVGGSPVSLPEESKCLLKKCIIQAKYPKKAVRIVKYLVCSDGADSTNKVTLDYNMRKHGNSVFV